VKLRVDRDILAEAVTWTARSVPARPPVPVLAGVRLEAKGSSLILASFDYEVSAHCEVAADVEEDGVVLVSGRLLADIAKALPNKPVDLEVDGNKVAVSCGSARFSLAAMAADDYPALPVMPAVAGTIDAHDLARAVAQVSIAASRDDTLPLLTSVQMEVKGSSLVLMATDRYRLAMRELTWSPANTELSTTALLKARTLSDVAKSLTSSGDVTVALSSESTASSLIGFEAGGRRTTSLLTDGDYPPVRRLFPESTSIHATVGTDELMGLEGAASNAYFDCLSKLVPEDVAFHGRSRRPPKDLANAAFSGDGEGVWLDKNGKKVLVDGYEATLQRQVKGALPGFAGTWRRHIHHQAQLLGRAIVEPDYRWSGASWR